MPQKSGSTGNMVNHLKRHHGFTQKPNAWKDFEELSSLKDKHLQKKKPESREEQPNKAVYTAILVACGWAGAVISLCKPRNGKIRDQK